MKISAYLLLLPVLCVTACGFQPMYGSHSAAMQENASGHAINGAMSDIEIAIIPDREGQILRNELIDQLQPRGPSANPRYKLTFSKLNATIRELDLTKSSEATRAQIIASVAIYLTDTKTGEQVLSRPLKSISSYNILPSEFATNVTEDNARKSALKDIARQIQLQLSLYFNR